MEPYLKLAFAMRDTPGGYAVLLGAGASIAAGMPSAWDVQRRLIERLAAAEGVSGIGEPHIWYQERYGRAATYDGLLAELTNTPFERQAMLRSYFEPDEQEREEGRKRPTVAHRAVARLVAAGHVRIVLTTNFDRLIETALREAGVEPTVVAGSDGAAGLAPLHTIKCLVVHLHGDYLTPTSMLNTPEELDRYAPDVDALLDRVFADYGLVISGWSATWDPALRNALSRSTTRFFASYWTDPRELSEVARELLIHRGTTYVQTDADTFFAQAADAVDALVDTARQHPASIEVAVAVAKRALSGTGQAISLHDTLRREISRVASLPLRTSGPWGAYDTSADTQTEHGRRLDTLEAEAELLLALVATTAYWGTNSTDRWWLPSIEHLGAPLIRDGDTALIRLVQAPATMMVYAAGIAALAAERWATLVRVLHEPTAHNEFSGKTYSAAALLSPQETFGIGKAASERLHTQLHPVFTQHVALSETAYLDAWERFEYLRLLVQHDAELGFSQPHIRPRGFSNLHTPAPSTWLKKEIDRYGDNHPLILAGLLGGDLDRLQQARKATATTLRTKTTQLGSR
ncbi:SIR2 family protein [Streptomyces sp. NPDC090499]|uniref:SIR2 family protein n=1 Tax=Streptomyces sp. NPDC090499 TaxID=3365965 RepID=UPI00380787C9